MKTIFLGFFIHFLIGKGQAKETCLGSAPNPDGGNAAECQKPFYFSQLSTTYCAPPYNASSFCFETMPLTIYQAKDRGWRRISAECSNNGVYAGYRYILGNDYSVSLLYNINGLIAGIQTNMLAINLTSCDDEYFRYKFEEVPYFTLSNYYGHDYFTLTAYFVNPETICCDGRTLTDYKECGFGEGVWLQSGEDSSMTEFISTFRPTAAKKHWDRAKCVSAMGYHNFKDMDLWTEDYCLTIPPYDIQYDNYDMMIGINFLVFGLDESDRYEHIPASIVQLVMNGEDCPDCVVPFINSCNLTTMHVYFIPDPDEWRCPPGQSVFG